MGNIGLIKKFVISWDFPYGVSLEPIQTRNLRDDNNNISPSLILVDFLTRCPSSSPSDPGTGLIGAYSIGQRLFNADTSGTNRLSHIKSRIQLIFENKIW